MAESISTNYSVALWFDDVMQKEISLNKNLKNLQKQQLFVGSGVEDTIDENLHTELDNFGQYCVDYREVKKDDIEKVLMNSDESQNEDELAKDIFSEISDTKYNNQFGFYTDLYVGHVNEKDFRKNGSSGGFVSWLAVKLLEQGKIDGYIHVKKTSTPGLLFEYGISRTVDDIKSGAKSRYYPAELSKVLKEVKEKPGKYAVVGIPEIITELRLLAENDEIINERIKYYFGLVCGHQKTTKYAEAIAWEYGISPGDLEDIDFRVKKNTGTAIEYDMKFTGKVNGRKKTFIVKNNEPFVSSWAHGFFKARFSDFTDNSFNEVADITFGDAWLDEYMSDPMGNNILIVRNQDIAKIIKDSITANQVKLDVVDQEVILRSQLGLVHHTRDELPYRLYKEAKRHGWAPKKRVEPSNELDSHRKKVQDARQEIAEKSHIYYQQAIERNDFSWFKKKMQKLVDEYNWLYGQPTSKKSKRVHADGAILTLTGYFNYGNVLQRYALQKFLQKSGYSFVSYVDPYSASRDIYRVSRKARLKTPLRALKRLLRRQRPYWYKPKYGDIYPEAHRIENIINFVNKNIFVKQFDPRDNYKNYIVGSDQVWRDWWGNREISGYYFLNFLKGRKANRIAYAASFGKDKIEEVMNKDTVEYIRPYIEQFNGVSAREKSGVKMVEKTWGIKGVREVVDPTLLLDVADYSRLINQSSVEHEKIQPIFTYVIDETDDTRNFVQKVSDSRGQSFAGMRAHGGAEDDTLPPVELWLKGFRDAELVVTNSFHGMMFSVINNTDFIIIGREDGGLLRIKDFLSEYGISGRFVGEAKLADFDLAKLKQINWMDVNEKLERRRKESGQWLLAQLNN